MLCVTVAVRVVGKKNGESEERDWKENGKRDTKIDSQSKEERKKARNKQTSKVRCFSVNWTQIIVWLCEEEYRDMCVCT